MLPTHVTTPDQDLAGHMSRRIAYLVILLMILPTAARARSADAWSWPLERPELAGRFSPPADRYGPGHRGIDIAGSVGDVVRAVAAGRVTFAGDVAGVPVITIDHGSERSTYQPVDPRVEVGDAIESREAIGTLLGTHSHCTGACLHLGRRVGRDYLDPLMLLGHGRFVLISPDGPPPSPPLGVGGTLRRPVGGPISSPFGMRVHPLTGVRKLHDGTDFAVPCGTPVHAARSGVVTALGRGGPYGTRITIGHAPGFETSYNHLSSQAVSVGQQIADGEVIGRSGNTGMSTGCHLHFMVLKNRVPTDPQSSL